MNKIIFILQKTRNSDGLGKQIHLKWEPKYLRIVNEDDDTEPQKLNFNRKEPAVLEGDVADLISDEEPEEKEAEQANGNKLLDMLMSSTL